MQTALALCIEKTIDRIASALFAAACGYAAYVWFAAQTADPALAAESGAVAAFAYLCCSRTLAAVDPARDARSIPMFDLRDYEPAELEELLLTDRYEPQAAPAAEPLVLDDVLAELQPDSRVVRLFDPAAMPTAAELRSRIDRHLDREQSAAESEEATQALREALSELRRSIR